MGSTRPAENWRQFDHFRHPIEASLEDGLSPRSPRRGPHPERPAPRPIRAFDASKDEPDRLAVGAAPTPTLDPAQAR